MTETVAIPRPPHVKPAVFEEFFGTGKEEVASPFLTPRARKWAANLTLKTSLVAMGLLILAFLLSFSSSAQPLSSLFLVGVYFLAGIPSLIEAIEDLADFDINIDTLMTLAAFSSVLIGSGMEGGLLLVLFSLSGSIEDAVTAKAKGSLNQLHKLSPSKATVLDARGHLRERAVKDIVMGTHILVRAGEIVPLDGIVIDGISSVNLVHLTGENMPITKKKGDEVPAGARNLEGTLTLLVTHTSADSTMTRIIQLVTQAQEAKPRLQRWFDRFSRTYALAIILLSAFFALTFPFLLSIPFLGFEGSLYRALAFLIAASPCALILALPIAYLSAVSACARKGILLKGGIVLDALAQCSIIAFDKTGTLTTGELSFNGLRSIGPSQLQASQKEILAIAYALEKNAVHPIARAITTYAQEKNILSFPLQHFKSIPGYGIEASVEWKHAFYPAFMGHPDYVQDRLTSFQQQQLEAAVEAVRQDGHLLAILLFGPDLYLFTFQDNPRPYIKDTVHRLKQTGDWELLMLTGDHETSARRIAKELGVDEFYANLRPEHKLEHVTRLAQDKGLAMVGDGINDAPALARATVGICMGKIGSGTAVDAADVVLLHDNLESLDWLMAKAQKTRSIVQENLVIAIGAIFIASFPALAGWVPLWLAVVMHEGGTVLVGLNALRLLR
ncbi:heavy metal translocating P-type ATPase [Candidatus Protochlamydia phocaeensis]|uniref:heavy metal translocating P-type ATPase n=1 Tax=Candidatus Protochlamydia phocaeensis TaxID=1414722 RepID=UPI000838BDEB|nr:heavy metal translocating P-type ATPase [Candidatus Protochlamydia phocaeensis]